MTNFFPSLTRKQTSVGANVAKGVVAGAIGGFIASWAMNHVHGLGQKFSDLSSSGGDGEAGSSHSSSSEESGESDNEEEKSDPATTQVATEISRRVLRTELTKK